MKLPYRQIALTRPSRATKRPDTTTRPGGSRDQLLDRTGRHPAPTARLQRQHPQSGGTVTGGTVDPTPTHFTSGDVRGTIYRFVVWGTTRPAPTHLPRVAGHEAGDRRDHARRHGGRRRHAALPGALHGDLEPGHKPDFDPNPGPACTGGADCDTATGRCTGTDCTGGGNPNQRRPLDLLAHRHAMRQRQPPADQRGPPAAQHERRLQRPGWKNSSTTATQRLPAGAPDLMFTSAPPLSGETPI